MCGGDLKKKYLCLESTPKDPDIIVLRCNLGIRIFDSYLVFYCATQVENYLIKTMSATRLGEVGKKLSKKLMSNW